MLPHGIFEVMITVSICNKLARCTIWGKKDVKLSVVVKLYSLSLVQFCQPRTISHPYFPKIVHLA